LIKAILSGFSNDVFAASEPAQVVNTSQSSNTSNNKSSLAITEVTDQSITSQYSEDEVSSLSFSESKTDFQVETTEEEKTTPQIPGRSILKAPKGGLSMTLEKDESKEEIPLQQQENELESPEIYEESKEKIVKFDKEAEKPRNTVSYLIKKIAQHFFFFFT